MLDENYENGKSPHEPHEQMNSEVMADSILQSLQYLSDQLDEIEHARRANPVTNIEDWLTRITWRVLS